MVVVLVEKTFPPVTSPELEPIEATAITLLLQVPPIVASLKTVVVPAHMVVFPVMAAGNGFTVTVTVRIQPVGNV